MFKANLFGFSEVREGGLEARTGVEPVNKGFADLASSKSFHPLTSYQDNEGPVFVRPTAYKGTREPLRVADSRYTVYGRERRKFLARLRHAIVEAVFWAITITAAVVLAVRVAELLIP